MFNEGRKSKRCKVKVHPQRPRGGYRYSHTPPLSLPLDGVRGQRHASAVLLPGRRPVTHCSGGWVSSTARMVRCGSEVNNAFIIRTSSVMLQKVTNSLCLIHTPANVSDNDFLCFTFKGKCKLIHMKGQKDTMRFTDTWKMKQDTYVQ